MPTIYDYLGILFKFFANDHEPIHVHIKYGEFQNKLVFIYKNGKLIDIEIKKVAGFKPLPTNKLNDALHFAKKYERRIVEKWTEFYALHKKLSCERITKKI